MSDGAKVGLVVLVTGILLTAAVFAIANLRFGGVQHEYRTHFKFAGGLEPGAPVRYGGLKVGRVRTVRVDPRDVTQVEVTLEVKGDTPIRQGSTARLSQLGMLSDNYVEIDPGKSATALPPGAEIPSAPTVDLTALIAKMGVLVDSAQPVIIDLQKNLNQISAKADTLLAQLNEVTGPENQKHFRSILKETDGMIGRNAEKIDRIATNFNDASAEVKPLLADLRKSADKLQTVLDSVNGMVGENREKFKTTLDDLDKTLNSARSAIEQVQAVLDSNGDNIEMTIDNLRVVTENMRELTDTVKQRPYSLIRVKPLPDRAPPGALPAKNGKKPDKANTPATTKASGTGGHE